MRLIGSKPASRQIVKAVTPQVISMACAELERLARPTCHWCPAPAALLLAVHELDCCTGGREADLSPDGAAHYLGCAACVDYITNQIRETVDLLVQAAAPYGRVCKGCSHPIRTVDDVIGTETL